MSTADLASLLGQPRLRVYDCTTSSRDAAARERRPVRRRARTPNLRGGAHSRGRLPRSAGRVLRRDHAAALHDAGDGPARGGLRPSRARRRQPRRALQHRHHDVGDALLVDAPIARLRRRGRPRRRLRQVEGRGPADRERRRPGLSAGHVHGLAAPGLLRRQARGAGGDQKSRAP